ncbi:MAG: TIGR02221 family CRISPR-associated protein [Anaerolineae bacterium]|nr:TIGR02221 family CRISPR-associated protein [Anaerolineae bacterium]
MKVISFLGTADYKRTTFVWNEMEKETRLFPVAVAHFIRPDELLICATPTVQSHSNLDELKRALEEMGTRYRIVPIPEGHSEADLWQIFGALTDAVGEGEQVVFDVTHSFRSLPFLAFLAVAYLQVAKKVKVERVLYGAWEARETIANRSPVFDLTPFVRLLNWLTATDQFIQTGDARRLAALLNTGGKNAARASEKLSQVSLAAFLCQPFTLMDEALTLDKTLRSAETELAQTAPPFGVLREQIIHTFAQFGADKSDPRAMLVTQFRLIEWYVKNNQLIQAMTLAREWVISAVTWRLQLPIDLNLDARKQIEDAINGIVRIGREDATGEFRVTDLNEHGRRINEWQERDELKELWTHLSPIRNALDHAEHQKDAMKLKKIVNKAQNKVMPRLCALAEKWGLIDTKG